MRKACVAVLGSANADLYVEISRFPFIGETLPASGGGEMRPGGKGANTAAGASMLQAKTFFLGQVGCDAAGQILISELSSRGVITDHITKVDTPSGQAIIILFPDGQNSIILIGGANQSWSSLPDSMKLAIDHSDALMLQREIPESINSQAAAYAKSRGKLVVLDAGGKLGHINADLLKNVDILSPNEVEIAEITDIKDDVKAAAQVLRTFGVKHVLVKLGSQGSLYVGEFGEVQQDCFSVQDLKIVDTCGAGDCFTAAFTTRLLEIGCCSVENFKNAMQFASVAAFLNITSKGAMNSMPSREAVDKYFIE
jgi:ribokinase